MSHMTQTKPASQAGASAMMNGLARAERITTIVAIVLAAAAAIYLLVTLLTEHEVCYGMRADRLLCQPVDAVAAQRAALVLLYPGVLFAAAAAAAFWQTRATDPGARSTAYGLLVTSVAVLIGIVVPALAGAGLFLAPATLAITVAAVLGTIKFVQDFRAGRAAGG
ncbi:MAG TPA: hypothetical protein VFQ25_11210 [Ktedonobacterales bacterium]|nr:hypothetical protein [Ktedonobacterales bacterium]